MNDRDRFLRTVRFEPVDRLPVQFAYGLMPGLLEQWHAQGLPRDLRTRDEISDYFGLSPRHGGPLGIDLGPRPSVEGRVLKDDQQEYVAVDGWGRTLRTLKQYASIPIVVGHPVADRASWEKLKPRLAFSAERVPDDIAERMRTNRDKGLVNRFGGMGFYWFPRDMMGDEGLCIAYYEDPGLVHDMCDTWCTLCERIIETVCGQERLDQVHLGEDMAYRNGPMIGPDTFDQFLKPYYQRIQRLVDRYEVPVFSLDTDGSVGTLLEWVVPLGINFEGPNEVQAGNDVRALRSRFGKSLAYDGGLDKRVLTQGRDAIDAMLDELVPPMMAGGGGWVPALDHRVLLDTPLDDYRHFIERLRAMTEF